MSLEINGQTVILPLLLEDCWDKVPSYLHEKRYLGFRSRKEHRYSYQKLLDIIVPRVKIEQTSKGTMIGRRRLRLMILADGQDRVFRRKDNFLRFDANYVPPALPPDLEKTRLKLLNRAKSQAFNRGSPLENNELVRVIALKFKTEAYDDFVVILGSNEYFQYIPFRSNLDERLVGSNKTIREKYFKNPLDIENCLIPSEVSVNVIVVCEKGRKLVIPERSAKVAQAPGNFSESVGGAVALKGDFDSFIQCPSPFLAASREANEELHIRIPPDDVYFRRIIIGLDDPAACFIGEVQTDLTEDEIRDSWCLATAKEYVGLHFVDFDPESFVRFRREHPTHDMPPICEFAFLSCLIGKFGLERVEQALR